MTTLPASRALTGLRVLDLTHYIAGPYCTKLLADQGADVVKVERPGGGDAARRLGPFPGSRPNPEASGLFLFLNTNKLGITLDLRSATGRDLALRLAANVDLVIESFKPGTLERFGLGERELRAANARLTICSISSFGQTGPHRDYRATELVLQALGGFMCVPPREREPLGVPFALAQYLAGVRAYIACLAAGVATDQGGDGGRIDISIADALSAIPRTNVAPAEHSFLASCRDGDLAMTITDARGRSALRTLIGPDLLGGSASLAELESALKGWLKTKTTDEGSRAVLACGVPCVRVASTKELVGARAAFQELEGPDTKIMRLPGTPFSVASAMPRGTRRAPRLGEHNQAVLCDRLGLTTDDLLELFESGVI